MENGLDMKKKRKIKKKSVHLKKENEGISTQTRCKIKC